MKINIVQAWVIDVEEFRIYLNEELLATFPDKDSATALMKQLVILKLKPDERD